MVLEEKKAKTVLVTGPNGFVGRQLILDLKTQHPNWKIKVISRSEVAGVAETLDYESFRHGRFDHSFFKDVDSVVHLAGLAHKFHELKLEELDSVNVDFLREILSVLNIDVLHKFVFLSSYSVSLLERGVILDTVMYAKTKQKGEELLDHWFHKTSQKFEVVILKPSMVYGRGAPGNFDKLIRLLSLPVPLPFGSFQVPRSFIHVKNLSSAIVQILKCSTREGFSTWEISDPWVETFSGFVSDLNRTVQGRAKVFLFPLSVLKLCLILVGKKGLFEKLILSFKIDASPFMSRYDWRPPVNFENRFKDLNK